MGTGSALLFSVGYVESECCLLYLSLYRNAKFLNDLFARKVLSIIHSV
jgi:hypothetical protein